MTSVTFEDLIFSVIQQDSEKGWSGAVECQCQEHTFLAVVLVAPVFHPSSVEKPSEGSSSKTRMCRTAEDRRVGLHLRQEIHNISAFTNEIQHKGNVHKDSFYHVIHTSSPTLLI